MGTGINRIRKSMKSSNLPAPEFKFYEHSFYTTLIDKTGLGITEKVAEKQEQTTQKIQSLPKGGLLTLLKNMVGSELVERVSSKLAENQ